MAPGEVPPAPQPASRIYRDLVFRPATAFRTLRNEPLDIAVRRYGLLLFAVLVLGAALAFARYWSLSTQSGSQDLQPFLWTYGGTFIQFLLVYTAGVFAFSFAYHLMIWLGEKQRGYYLTLAVLLYAVSPLLVGSMIINAIAISMLPAMFWFLPILLLWSAALFVIGIREGHGIPAGRAAVPLGVVALLVAMVFLGLSPASPL